MEERKPKHETEPGVEKPEAGGVRRLKRWFEAQTNWREVLGIEQKDAKDDDDEESSSEKKGLFSRLNRFREGGFSKLFKSSVAEIVPVEDGGEQQDVTASWFKSAERDEADQAEAMLPALDLNSEASFDDFNDTPEPFEPSSRHDRTPDLDSDHSEKTPVVATGSGGEGGGEPPEVTSAESTPEPSDDDSHREAPGAVRVGVPLAERAREFAAAPHAAVEHTGSDTAVTERVEHSERVIERSRGALAAFVAAEAFSRHRDREIRKDAGALHKEVINSKTQQSVFERQSYEQQQVLKREVRDLQNAPKVEQARPQSPERVVTPGVVPAVERQVEQPTVAPAIPRVETNRAEAQPAATTRFETSQAERAPGLVAPITAERIVEQLAVAPEQGIKPSEVLKQVESAAEQNIPVESILERRHEVKDGPHDNRSLAANQPIGLSDDTVSNGSSKSNSSVFSRLADPNHTDPRSEAYHKAVMQGVGGGMFFIFMLILFFLLR